MQENFSYFLSSTGEAIYSFGDMPEAIGENGEPVTYEAISRERYDALTSEDQDEQRQRQADEAQRIVKKKIKESDNIKKLANGVTDPVAREVLLFLLEQG